ncbi:complement C1q tumor necrosis factor-related protein 3-like [Mercenaria mercenaria]|uniref:complement C1q tumor necrosis factor-related protein 3-like n=1 Tax=Mercenaria mercenaria TaxID=6596 RepID=UPI00234E9001|nr:complement C1q tumor necrosis factor-related protein 3-like [Mercenaria mercenaria]
MNRHFLYIFFCVNIVIFVGFETVIALNHEMVKSTSESSEDSALLGFKKAVIQELQEMKGEMLLLKMENEEKDSKIKNLEQKVANLEKGQRHSVIRGRRGMFQNIAFTAYLDHSEHNLTQDQPIIYNKVLLNDGGGYNTNTGMFTAPVAGVYLFSYSVGAKVIPDVHLSQYDVFTRLIVDGVHQLSAVAESTSTWDDEQGSTTAIVYVPDGATVWTKHEFKGGNNLYSAEFERITSFAGTLLYEKEPVDNSGIIG